MANSETTKTLDQLWNSAEAATEAGQRLAQALDLKPDQLNRYHTEWGPRNAVGLTRTVLNALELY